MLGVTDQNEELTRLHKSSISLSNGSDDKISSYPSSLFVCAQLLSLIESTALKKFIVHSGPSQDSQSVPLLLWVFNPDIYYSCSAFEGNSLLSSVNSDTIEQKTQEQTDTNQETQVNNDMLKSHQAMNTNPNGDDVSQIYGEPTQSQKLTGTLTGDMHLELPLPRNRTEGQTKTVESIPTVLPTETATIGIMPRKTPSPPTPSAAQPRADGNDPNQHVNLVHRAAKIFYQAFTSSTNVQEFLDMHSTTHEELFLPNPFDLSALKETLENTTAMLPASARTFQDWQVGLLDRYEKNPSGLGVMQENPLARGIQAKDGRVTRWDVGHGAEGLYA